MSEKKIKTSSKGKRESKTVGKVAVEKEKTASKTRSTKKTAQPSANTEQKQQKQPKKKQQKQQFSLTKVEPPKTAQKYKMSLARKGFLSAFESTFGNISASCEFA